MQLWLLPPQPLQLQQQLLLLRPRRNPLLVAAEAQCRVYSVADAALALEAL
jgi:hypothetical protein